MVEKDKCKAVTVKLEEYAGSLESYWAREEDHFLSGRFSRNGPNLVMRIPMQMPKRLDGTGFVDLEHWFCFRPFIVDSAVAIPSFCEETKAIAGKFEPREYCGRVLDTFEIQPPKKAPHLLVGPITLPHPVEQSDLDVTLRLDVVYLHPIVNPDETLVRSCYVVIRFGDRIVPSNYTLERSSTRAKHDRVSVCQQYNTWLAEELTKTDFLHHLSARLLSSHRRTSRKFLDTFASLQNMVEIINEESSLNHTLTLFPGGATYDGEIYFDNQPDIDKLSGLIHKQFDDILKANENAKEVIRIFREFDADSLAYLHLEFIHSIRFAAFILRDISSGDCLCCYAYGDASTGNYDELLSLSPEALANKIRGRFSPIMLAAATRLENLKALQRSDQLYTKNHPRATPTRPIEPTQFL